MGGSRPERACIATMLYTFSYPLALARPESGTAEPCHGRTGRVQPARAALIAERGRHGYYHYNAIVSWAVASDGRVRHTYVDAVPVETEFEGLFIDDD